MLCTSTDLSINKLYCDEIKIKWHLQSLNQFKKTNTAS